jgi:hypothetical protein
MRIRVDLTTVAKTNCNQTAEMASLPLDGSLLTPQQSFWNFARPCIHTLRHRVLRHSMNVFNLSNWPGDGLKINNHLPKSVFLFNGLEISFALQEERMH